MTVEPGSLPVEAVAPLLSVVVPCYNEEAVLPLLRERLRTALDALGVPWEVVLVDDGSRDRTPLLLAEAHAADPRFKALLLSRNFGQETATLAGLCSAAGQTVAILDADLQDPPELLGECLRLWREGNEVVYAVRRARKEGLPWRIAYGTYYRLLRRLSPVDIPLDAGGFCLMDRKVVDVLRAMPESFPIVRGMRAWCGFRQVGLPYDRPARAAGSTKHHLVSLVRLALGSIFSHSTVPLQLASWLGLLLVLVCLAGASFVVVWRLAGFSFMGHTAAALPGWAAAMTALLFLGGVQMLILGVIGTYLARVYEEVRRRPRWVVRAGFGLDAGPARGEPPRR